MAFPPSLLDEIRARVAISEVVGKRVSWDRRKTNAARGDWWACCPFHNEKSPSFHAEDSKGRYHCFGCGASGDIFKFLMETESLAFPEAVELLANQAGLEVPKSDPREVEREARRASLHQVMEKATAFYEAALKTPAGRTAREYLERRGLKRETIEKFRLGAAPNGRHALKEHLAGAGITQEQMIEAGLLVAGDDIPVSFDRFRDRVMFPIPDSRGRIIAFGARALSPDAQAKYLNSPDTPLFSKGGVLYNYLNARKAVREAGTVIVAEGYMDVIALDEAGIGSAVAPLGTALTDRQLQLLWRLTPEPVLCFDGDTAGQRAALRAVETALPELKPGFSLRFAFLPEGQDPDDLIRSAGAGAMEEVLAGARPLIDMLWDSETREVPQTPERRAALEARLEELLARIGDERVRKHYRAAVGERLARMWQRRAEPRAGEGRRPRRADRGARKGENAAPAGATTELRRSALARGLAGQVHPREALIVLTMINHPGLIEAHMEDFAAVEFALAELDSLRRRIIDIAAAAPGLEERALKAQLREQGFATILGRMERTQSHGGDWFAQPDAPVRDAEIGWLHILARQRKAIVLVRELAAAERALAAEPSEERAAALGEAREAIDAFDGNEAAIEGFGRAGSQGRSSRPLDAWIAANRHRLP